MLELSFELQCNLFLVISISSISALAKTDRYSAVPNSLWSSFRIAFMYQVLDIAQQNEDLFVGIVDRDAGLHSQ